MHVCCSPLFVCFAIEEEKKKEKRRKDEIIYTFSCRHTIEMLRMSLKMNEYINEKYLQKGSNECALLLKFKNFILMRSSFDTNTFENYLICSKIMLRYRDTRSRLGKNAIFLLKILTFLFIKYHSD